MIKVNLVSTDGQAAVIEYKSGDRIERVIIPNTDIKGGRISQQTLKESIPFGGIELEDYLPEKLTINTSDLQDMLRQRGLWTEEDYLKNPGVILGALQKLYGVDVTRILNMISEAGNDNDI